MDSLALLNRLKDLRGSVNGIKGSIPSNPENEDLLKVFKSIEKSVSKAMKSVVATLKKEVDLLED